MFKKKKYVTNHFLEDENDLITQVKNRVEGTSPLETLLSIVFHFFFYAYFLVRVFSKYINQVLISKNNFNVKKNTKKKFSLSQQTNRARPARKFSLSPVRRSELPGSPDVDFTNESSLVEHAVPSTQLKQIGTGGCTTKRHATVLSPIKKPYKNKA